MGLPAGAWHNDCALRLGCAAQSVGVVPNFDNDDWAMRAEESGVCARADMDEISVPGESVLYASRDADP